VKDEHRRFTQMSQEIRDRLERIEKRLEAIEKMLSTHMPHETPALPAPIEMPFSAEDLLKIPDTLRKSVMAVSKLGEATADKIAEVTGRTRSIESIYLNQLVRMGYIQRIKRGRKIYFKIMRYL